MTSSKGITLSATVPVDIVAAFGLLPGKTYTTQLQDGDEARIYFPEEQGEAAPVIATVEAAPTGTTASPRPLRLANDTAIEITTGEGPRFLPIWSWDAGEGVLAIISTGQDD